MSSSSYIPFATPDSPGDVSVILVLLENSGAMHGNWSDIRNFYLPHLLEALRSAQPAGTPIHIIWQLAASPYDPSAGASTLGSIYSEAHRQIPDFQFDATSTPLSPTTLRQSIEELRGNVPRDHSSTRHLVVVAMSQPVTTSPAHSHPNMLSNADNWQSIALLLHQDRVRLHMILHSSSQLDIFRDVFYNNLTIQTRAEIPPWFQVNPRHTIHLSANSTLFGSARGSPTLISSSAPPSVPVTPGITTSSLPLSSPGYEATSSGHALSSSPPTRRSRPKLKEGQAAPSSQDSNRPGPGQLVDYIKQIHGLTKKRTPGGKTAKKAGTSEQPRASTSRPILPRLELPPANLSTDSKGKTTERAALEAASSGGSRYAAIAPAGQTRPSMSEEGHHGPAQSARRWPWLQPAPVLSSATPEESGLSPSAAATLRNLQTIAPRMPGMGTQLPGEPHSPPRTRRATTHGGHTTAVPTSTSTHRHATYPTRTMSPPIDPTMMQRSQGSPSYPGSQGYSAEEYGDYVTQSQYPAFASAAGHDGPVSSSPPGVSAQSSDDAENQPFVITPEYEALANAEFEQAVRSGAMQASMSPTTMSPVATSPGMQAGATGYFPSEPVGSANMMSPSMQQTPIHPTQAQQLGTAYAPYHHEQQLARDVRYHQAHGQSPPGTSTTPSSSPPRPSRFYNPHSPPGNDPSQARRWYG
ncbi:hypothetical protein BDY19DRAFT_524777 [Irpex rosettiformis]|uniref:Uncharacterized protein n=1 Tax=Irpex rosettiformis TaxID=378272 RepID=A0ACB8TR55_9APHY|nr:hypothetical protein BDY19DRAFT_524777 [Irpex rosettiformis]